MSAIELGSENFQNQLNVANGVKVSVNGGMSSELLRPIVETFMDVLSTSTGRATHYNSREEQELLEKQAHEQMFAYNRNIYGALLSLPGTLERAQQVGIFRLLADRTDNGICVVEGADNLDESMILKLISNISVPRQLKTFLKLKENRVNNARARRIVLTSILDVDNLEHRAVTYRKKYESLLRHFVGHKKMVVIKEILSKSEDDRLPHEVRFVNAEIARYAKSVDFDKLSLCVAFIMGSENEFIENKSHSKCPKIASYIGAKVDLNRGQFLTPEVLEGIRSRFHPEQTKERVLQLTAKNMTDRQRMRSAKRTESARVDVAFNPRNLTAVELYVYALERGMTSEIAAELDAKGKLAGAEFPVKFSKVAVVVDKSQSMTGTDTNKNRPYAVAMAMKDALIHTGSESVVEVAGGGEAFGDISGDTSLSESLVNALLAEPDVVYVITDGYENAPAGRFAQTVGRVRELGIQTPIYQLSPVSGAEASGVRKLSNDVLAMPVSDSKALGMPFLKGMLKTNAVEAVRQLASLSLSKNQFLKLENA